MAADVEPNASSTSIVFERQAKEPFTSHNLPNQYFLGPQEKSKKWRWKGRGEGKSAYASISILEPIITVERHDDKYHVAARFNIETTILGYDNRRKSGHERFFQDICLQYLSSTEEKLIMKPESSPASAFAVTRNTATTTSGGAELNLAQVPSGKVSLGLSRSRELTVEYALDTWTVSAHRIVHPGSPQDTTTTMIWPLRRAGKKKYANGKAKAAQTNAETPRYQWFWQGTQAETSRLSPDLTQTVKRHVVIKRIIPAQNPPRSAPSRTPTHPRTAAGKGKPGYPRGVRPTTPEEPDLRGMLDFGLRIHVRLKKRHGPLKRLLHLTTNPLSAQTLRPTYTENFRIRVGPGPPARKDDDSDDSYSYIDGGSVDDDSDDYADDADTSSLLCGLPRNNTYDIDAILDDMKDEYKGRWDQLQARDLLAVADMRRIMMLRSKFERSERESMREREIAAERDREWEQERERKQKREWEREIAAAREREREQNRERVLAGVRREKERLERLEEQKRRGQMERWGVREEHMWARVPSPERVPLPEPPRPRVMQERVLPPEPPRRSPTWVVQRMDDMHR